MLKSANKENKSVGQTYHAYLLVPAWQALLVPIWLALLVLVAKKLKSIQFQKSVAQSREVGESLSLKQTTIAQTTGRATARPNSHKWKSAFSFCPPFNSEGLPQRNHRIIVIENKLSVFVPCANKDCPSVSPVHLVNYAENRGLRLNNNEANRGQRRTNSIRIGDKDR